jgi:hypothetical protein
LADAAHVAAEACDDALSEYNDAVSAAGEALRKAIAELNTARDALVLEVESHVDAWESEIEDRSESWQRSEAGEAAREKVGEWREWVSGLWSIEIELHEDLDLDRPDFDMMPDLNNVTA